MHKYYIIFKDHLVHGTRACKGPTSYKYCIFIYLGVNQSILSECLASSLLLVFAELDDNKTFKHFLRLNCYRVASYSMASGPFCGFTSSLPPLYATENSLTDSVC